MSAGRSDVPRSVRMQRLVSAVGESIRVAPVRSSASTARAWLRAILDGFVAHEVIDDALLVATELIVNSVEHTDSEEITVRVRLDGRGLVIQVHDQGPGLPRAWPLPGFRGRSRGLMMVGKLSSSVSSRLAPHGGAVVEVVLPIAAGPAVDA